MITSQPPRNKFYQLATSKAWVTFDGRLQLNSGTCVNTGETTAITHFQRIYDDKVFTMGRRHLNNVPVKSADKTITASKTLLTARRSPPNGSP